MTQWVARESYQLPELINDSQVLPVGYQFIAPDGTVWVVVHEQQHGGAPQPLWAAFPAAQATS